MIRFSSFKKNYLKIISNLLKLCQKKRKANKDHPYTFYTDSPAFNILLHLQALVCGCVCLYTYFLHLSRVKCVHHGPISSVQSSLSVASNCLRPHGLQHARLPCPSPTPGAYSNSCPLSWWCHQTISSSVIPFSSHLQFFPASGSFQMSQFFASGP